MRKKKSAINMIVGILTQLEIVLIGILNRRVFIQNLSIDYLGCNSVFVNVLEILSLVSCGTQAVTYLMIKAMASDDIDEIRKIFRINHVYQWITTSAIAVIGIGTSFFIPALIQNTTGFEWSFLQTVYLIFLLDICITNFSGITGSPGYYDIVIKTAQNVAICSFFDFLVKNLYIIGQCFILIYTKNYLLYLSISVFSKLIYLALTRYYCFKHYPYLKGRISVTYNQIKETNIFSEIRNNIAITIGVVVFNGTDSIVITGFLGVTLAGLYSNYQTIYNQLRGLISKFINGMFMSVADFIHRTDDDQNKIDLFYKVQFLCGVVGLVSSCCYFALVQPFITLVFGEGLLLDTRVVFVISIMLFLGIFTMGGAMFRHAMGKYWLDRNYQLVAAAINIILSVILVNIIGLSGILIGTIVGIMVTTQGYIKVVRLEAIEIFSVANWWKNVVVWVLVTIASLYVSEVILSGIGFTIGGMGVRLFGALAISVVFILLLCCFSKVDREAAKFYFVYIKGLKDLAV